MAHIMNLTLYVVQEQLEDFAEAPQIFQSHAQANHHYLDCVKRRYDSKLNKKKKELRSFQEAETYFIAQDDKKYTIRYWTIEAK